MENHLSNPLGYEPLPKLLRSFAVPSVIAMLVSSLYNIVDQIFIGQGVGYLGNAATNVAYPLTTICLAIALLIGIGSASRFSLSLGAGEPEQAARVVGNAIAMMAVLGILYALLVELFLHPLLLAFGATPDVMPYAIEYTRITALGMPLLIVTNAMSNLARADGSPKYSMTSGGRGYQHDPGPYLHFRVSPGGGRRCPGHGHWSVLLLPAGCALCLPLPAH